MDAKYHYLNAKDIWYEGNQHPCFAVFNHRHCKTKEISIKPVMSQENVTKWLTLLQDFHPFEWKYNNKNLVEVTMPETTANFVIVFGNLVKGISEFAWFCEEHLKDNRDLPFFVKSWEAFKKLENHRITVSYNEGHGWFAWKDADKKSYPRKSKTLQEVYKILKEKQPTYYIWSTCL